MSVALIGGSDPTKKIATVEPLDDLDSPKSAELISEAILSVSAAIREIGAPKDAEKHLAQMEDKYRGLLEAAPDAMVVVNQVGEIVLLNVQAEKQFGYSRDELIGQKVKNIIPEGFAERLLADDLRSDEDALAQQIGTGIELCGMRKDSSEFPIEIMLSPLESEEGILVTAAIRDISVRKAAEKHLAQMESRYRGLLEAAPDAMVVVNQRGEIVLLNVQAEKQFGYSRDELIGQKVTNIIPEGFAERLLADDLRSTEDALAQQIGTGIELIAQRKDRSEFPIEIMLSPLESDEGILVTAAIRDISKRRDSEEQLRQAQKMEAVGQLTGGMAHDFNNLLGIIVGNLDLLIERLEADPEAIQFANHAMEGALRGAELTKRMLAFARKQPLLPKAFDLNEALTTMVGMLQRTLSEDIAVQMAPGKDLWPAYCDKHQVEDVILNLAINARDAMPDGGTLHIETANVQLDEQYASQNVEATSGDYVMLAVSDSGKGMSPEIAARAFEPFFTTKPIGEGTGLGLSMVYGFAKQSSGHVRIYSEVGHGTTVRLYLPRAEADADISLQENQSANAAHSFAHETILVVEDNPMLRQLAVKVLEGLGYTVLQADSAAAAFAILDEDIGIDLLFTDIVMPGAGTGFDVAAAAKGRRSHMKVLLTTGYAENFVKNANSHLNLELISKPYRKQDLAARIRGMLDGDSSAMPTRQL